MNDLDKIFIPYIIFVLVIAGTRNNILLLLLIIITAILIFLLPKSMKEEISQNFKNESMIVKILILAIIIAAIYELITKGTISGLTAIVTLILMAARFVEYLKKEE